MQHWKNRLGLMTLGKAPVQTVERARWVSVLRIFNSRMVPAFRNEVKFISKVEGWSRLQGWLLPLRENLKVILRFLHSLPNYLTSLFSNMYIKINDLYKWSLFSFHWENSRACLSGVESRFCFLHKIIWQVFSFVYILEQFI